MSSQQESVDFASQFGEGASSIGRQQLLVIARARAQLLRQMADLSQTWSDGIRQNGEVEEDLLQRLAQSNSAAEILKVYSDWVKVSAATYLTEGQRLRNAYFKFCTDVMSSMGSGTAQS